MQWASASCRFFWMKSQTYIKGKSSDDLCDGAMTIVRVKIDPTDPASLKHSRVDLARVDATTEQDIQAQIEEDEKQAMLDAGQYIAGISKGLCLNQTAFTQTINVSSLTVHRWEHCKRSPSCPARAFLQILFRESKVAFLALSTTS